VSIQQWLLRITPTESIPLRVAPKPSCLRTFAHSRTALRCCGHYGGEAVLGGAHIGCRLAVELGRAVEDDLTHREQCACRHEGVLCACAACARAACARGGPSSAFISDSEHSLHNADDETPSERASTNESCSVTARPSLKLTAPRRAAQPSEDTLLHWPMEPPMAN
jgi:hypothetical protein